MVEVTKKKTRKLDTPILQSIFDGIPDGILVINREYKVVMCNDAIRKFMEKPSDEIRDHDCFYLCHEYNQACSDCAAHAVFSNSTPPSRIRECFKGNLKRRFEIWNFPIKNENGEVNYMIEYIKDVTDRQHMEKELNHARRLAIIGEVAAKTAHEIRNPLNAMQGAAHYLLEEYADDPKIQKYLNLIKDQISRLDGVSSDLLESARPRLSFGKKTLINSAILKSIEVVDSDMRDRKISIEIFLDERLPELRFDELRMQQVFINLLKNGCDAVGLNKKGVIEIVGHLKQVKGEDFVEISIIDNGVGIREADTDKIFNSFYSTKENGTGLGLSIVKDIMTSHGGYVFVESTPNGGTCASVGLPIQ
ncbi:MAG: hypothetical protein IEMM0002_1020 [bacterium]|nr:MAG: hypothetical protein IEMM0002_1020 [bacterium]